MVAIHESELQGTDYRTHVSDWNESNEVSKTVGIYSSEICTHDHHQQPANTF